MANKQLVVAFFENEDAADAAVDAIKKWDNADKEVKLGAIGVLTKDEKGKIKTDKVGKRRTKNYAVVGAVAAALSGGMTVVGGAVVGGILGAFFHKGMGLSKDDLARYDAELDGGKVAVCLLSKADEAAAVSAKLAELGGVPETHEVTDEAIEQAEAAVEEEDAS